MKPFEMIGVLMRSSKIALADKNHI